MTPDALDLQTRNGIIDNRRELLGNLAVDTGRLIMADPGNLCGDPPAISQEAMAHIPAGPIEFGSGAPHAGFVVETHGVEIIPVYAVYDGDKLLRIELDLSPEDAAAG